MDQKPAVINVKFLKQFPFLSRFHRQVSESGDTAEAVDVATTEEEHRTPLELIDSAFLTLKQATADDLLTKLKTCSPAFFESVVVKLLMAMGYGGIAGEGTVTGKSGDGGIDGVIKQDKLGPGSSLHPGQTLGRVRWEARHSELRGQHGLYGPRRASS